MKTRYIIRAESSNSEFETESQLREGIQVDEFFLVAIRDGEPAVECIYGMTTMNLARFFMTGSKVCSVLRQAAAIGEGMRNAEAIQEETEEQQSRKKVARIIAEKLGRISAEDLK